MSGRLPEMAGKFFPGLRDAPPHPFSRLNGFRHTSGWARHEHNQVKFNGQPAGSMKRSGLEDYFLSWAADRFPEDSLSTVYLVAAEGGGSRSGAWTAAVLTQLDSITGGRFQRQCFAGRYFLL